MSESTDLAAWRQQAALCSAGSSGSFIKDLVVRILTQEKLTGSLLDYGAGTGELLTILREKMSAAFPVLAGADLYPRPAGLPETIRWMQQDLNDPLTVPEPHDIVICSEVIEHLENPRQTMRDLARLVKPGGHLILTTPNQECIRSYVGLLFGGHFTSFLGACYPAHITPLLRLDLTRICAETGFEPPQFRYTGHGVIPKLTRVRWQTVTFGLGRGRLFSDNIGMIARRK